MDGVEVMDWFVGMRRMKYPATLYVTVKGTHVSAANLPRKTFGRITEVSVLCNRNPLVAFAVLSVFVVFYWKFHDRYLLFSAHI